MALYHIGKVLKAENTFNRVPVNQSTRVLAVHLYPKKKLTFYNKIRKPFEF